MKKILILFISAVLLLSLCACGEAEPYRIIAELGEKQYGAVFRLDDRAAAQFDAAMQVLAANGKLGELSRYWLGEDRISLRGDAAALEKLEVQPTPRKLIVGVEKDAPPFADSEGKGMSVDIALNAGTLLGWEIVIMPVNGSELETQLTSGNIDCALGFGVESVKTSKFTVVACYMKSDIVLAVGRESDIRSLRSLKGQKIGAIKDNSILSALSASEKVTKYADSVTAYLSPQRCVNALDKGWCAAVAMDEVILKAFFK